MTADATRDNLDAKLSVGPSVTSDGLPDDEAKLTDDEKWALGTFGHDGFPDAFTPSLIATVESILAGRVSGRADAAAQAWDEGRHYESSRHAECHMGLCVVNSESVNPYRARAAQYREKGTP